MSELERASRDPLQQKPFTERENESLGSVQTADGSRRRLVTEEIGS